MHGRGRGGHRRHARGNATEASFFATQIVRIAVAPLTFLHARSVIVDAVVMVRTATGARGWTGRRRRTVRIFRETASARFVGAVESLSVICVGTARFVVTDARSVLDSTIRRYDTGGRRRGRDFSGLAAEAVLASAQRPLFRAVARVSAL